MKSQAGESCIVRIARCPVHGLHGEREECFACRGPVEQERMVSVEDVVTIVSRMRVRDFDDVRGYVERSLGGDR